MSTPSTTRDAVIIERVAQHLTNTWIDFDVDEATGLVTVAAEALRASDGTSHFRPLMVDAMSASSTVRYADEVLDAIVDWVTQEHSAARTAERLGL
ncbi:hypothetical protein EXE59_09845 [Nocardioides eburneiflavus]|uniref:Uncharacterized protein n=1 Tax=Nocardioides eburneiflavus TaxID=2518372 RepID=A0A4Z1BSE4_9ACTN|nr:hypothetical protein [Nocardioides eburneiflavus]TGN64221.1 hypothetical protein EXE59_09845 [Nocardioides eburneiflavus]